MADAKNNDNTATDASPTPDADSGGSGSTLLKRHALANGLAALVSIAAVAWLGTQSAGGTGLVVGVVFILFNLGALLFGSPKKTKRHTLKHVVAWGLLSAASALIACSNAPPAPPQAPLPAAAASARGLRPVRAFLPAGQIPPAGVGAYGVLAFNALPTDASRARLKKVCGSYLATLPSQAAIPTSIPLSEQMITFWPVHGNPVPNPVCDWLLDNYDLFGGISAIQDAQSQGQTVRGRGPFLIGWSPSTARGVKDAVVLVVGLSPFESQDSFDEQLEFWRQEIVENPSVWRGGFSVERLRLAIRDWADRNGADITQSIKIWGK
jgi:hypothetical protein